MANWGSIFSDAFSSGAQAGMSMALKKKEMEADAKEWSKKNELEKARIKKDLADKGYILATGDVPPTLDLGEDIGKYAIDPNNPEVKYKLGQANYQNAMANLINNGGVRTPEDINNVISGGVPSAALGGASTYPPEDYMVTIETRNVRGVPVQQEVRKLKPVLPTAEAKEYRGFLKTELALNQNIDMLTKHPEFKKMMSPLDIRALRGGSMLGNAGNIIMKLDPKSAAFSTFKSETDKTFQQFRKETTGAQAALAELGWLAPDYPETTDNPTQYKTKAIEAIKRIQEAKEMLKQMWAPNYRMSGLEDKSNQKADPLGLR